MQVLWNKEIEEINSSGYLDKNLSVTDALIENFYNEILTLEEKKLLKLTFSENPTQEDLDNLLKDWDIEVKKTEKSLMLSYFMKYHPNLKFTSYEDARLKGLLTFYKFKNLKTISHFKKIVKALNEADIVPIILKGGAMKHLRPELPRVMSDIDILVKDSQFLPSADIVSELGYEYEKVDIHSIDFHPKDSEEGTVDLHRFIYMNTGLEVNFNKGLFKRAKKEKVFGVEAYVPSYEDLMFITLVNLARNLRDKTSQAGLLYSLFDFKYFLDEKPDFDWEIVKENAINTKTQIQINFAIKFISKIIPGIETFFEEETEDYSNMVMFNRFYLENLRQTCRAMKIKEVVKTPSMWGKYLVLKTRYSTLKGLRKHPKLIKLFIKDLRSQNAN